MTASVLMVDRGEVPKEKLDPATRAAGNVDGETQRDRRLAGARSARLLHAAARSGQAHLVCPRPGRHRRRRSSALAAPVVIEADATPNPGGWPKGGQTVVSFRNEHLSYAMTWFGLARCC